VTTPGLGGRLLDTRSPPTLRKRLAGGYPSRLVFWIGFAIFLLVVLAGIVWAWKATGSKSQR
jgi:hypothetical protein